MVVTTLVAGCCIYASTELAASWALVFAAWSVFAGTVPHVGLFLKPPLGQLPGMSLLLNYMLCFSHRLVIATLALLAYAVWTAGWKEALFTAEAAVALEGVLVHGLNWYRYAYGICPAAAANVRQLLADVEAATGEPAMAACDGRYDGSRGGVGVGGGDGGGSGGAAGGAAAGGGGGVGGGAGGADGDDDGGGHDELARLQRSWVSLFTFSPLVVLLSRLLRQPRTRPGTMMRLHRNVQYLGRDEGGPGAACYLDIEYVFVRRYLVPGTTMVWILPVFLSFERYGLGVLEYHGIRSAVLVRAEPTWYWKVLLRDSQEGGK
jgi:hypothetical protein